MKDRATQLEFIKARAEGKSYNAIAKALGLSKSTCTSWEHTLREEIDTLRQAQLEELYTAYGMTREARIKALGGILQNIDKAIAEKPLDELPADRLLELRLKYDRELKTEHREPTRPAKDNTLDGLLEQYDSLYEDSKAGSYTAADIRAQLSILDAKRELICSMADEMAKEEENPLDIIPTGYTSKLIRHEA